MSNAAKIRNRKYATRKLFGQNAVLIGGQRVELDEHGRVPSDTSLIPPKESYQSFLADEAQKEQAKKDAVQRETTRQMAVSILFSRESPELNRQCPVVTDFDAFADVSIDDLRKQIRDARKEALQTLKTESGIEVTPQGEAKLIRISALNRSLRWTDSQCWLACWDYAVGLQALVNGEDFVLGEPTQTSEPEAESAPQKSLDELLRTTDLSVSNRDAERELKAAVQNEFMGFGKLDLWVKWLDHLSADYNVSLTPAQRQEAWQYMVKMNLSPHQRSSYDAVRKFLVATGRLDNSCLSCREVLEQQYQSSEITDREYLRLLHEHEARLDRPRKEAGI